jgi:hypothetical protein
VVPVYVVTEVREYVERWLIEADSPEEAKALGGVTLDHDDGQGSDTGQSIEVEQVDDETEELP